ncbi:hypothetical protein PM082_014388 [Marasmius tenuissimus]|nr:hypothetical protein PM082_014388 [Marasmius tenuissimus]
MPYAEKQMAYIYGYTKFGSVITVMLPVQVRLIEYLKEGVTDYLAFAVRLQLEPRSLPGEHGSSVWRIESWSISQFYYHSLQWGIYPTLLVVLVYWRYSMWDSTGTFSINTIPASNAKMA